MTVNAGGQSRVFQVDEGVTASISGVTITGGSGNGGGAATATAKDPLAAAGERGRHDRADRLHDQRQLRLGKAAC